MPAGVAVQVSGQPVLTPREGKRVRLAVARCECGSRRDLIVPGPAWPPTCRRCFVEYDKRDEATMFAMQAVPLVDREDV